MDLSQVQQDSLFPGRYFQVLEDGRVQCNVCPRHCQLREGKRGFCFVRQNVDNRMMLTTYGRSSGFCIDPIEKKPLNHFYPGTSVLSFGTAGCNLGCRFCQNWDISKAREWDRLTAAAMPEKIAQVALNMGCKSVAFTYNDPVIFLEYAVDIAKACHQVGIKTVAVTAGYIGQEARVEFYDHMDAANIDLKAFTQEFYKKLCFSDLKPVLETLIYLKNDTNVWFEITNLIIPDANDSDDEIKKMVNWILTHLGPDVPVHYSAFHPDYKMMDRPPTPPETLTRARDISIAAGLKYVYTGNVHDSKGGSTYCEGCGQCIIERDWYQLGIYEVKSNSCGFCGKGVPGFFEDQPGTWGRKRLQIQI